MVKREAKVLIPVGFGLNCEKETENAFKRAGAEKVNKIHINDIIENNHIVEKYNIIAFIGGFSFGDHVSAGKVLANKLKYKLKKELESFVKNKNLIIGICNGFQMLVKLGLLPLSEDKFSKQEAYLIENKCEHYYDGWVKLKINKESPSIFTKNMEYIELPVRHGEGRIKFLNESILNRMIDNNQIVLQYVDKNNNVTEKFPENPNGSIRGIAGICDKTGHIFGLMPHPEAYINSYMYPNWKHIERKRYGDGYQIFKNCVDYIKER